MQLKLSQIKANPFHDGNYDKSQVAKIEQTIQQVGLMGSLPVVQKGKDYFLVYGHHRKKAAENVLGKNASIEVTLQKFSDDEAVWGMAVENLTQEQEKKKRIKELVGIRNYLKKLKKTAVGNTDSSLLKDGRKKGQQHIQEIGSSRHIAEWLNRGGREIVSFQEIADLLCVNDNLAPALYKKMESYAYNNSEKANEMNFSNALMLARATKDPKEQLDLHKAFVKSTKPFYDETSGETDDRAYRVRTRSKILTKYKEVKEKAEAGDEEAKKSIEAVRKGELDIAEVGAINIPFEPRKKLNIEFNIEFQEHLTNWANDIEDWKKNCQKTLSLQALERLFYSLGSWSQTKFAPFVADLVKEIKERDKNKKNNDMTFIFTKDTAVCKEEGK